MLITVPGGRVGRNLEALLVTQAAARGLPLFSPTLVTPSALIGSLLEVPGTAASPMASRLTWAEALQSCSEAVLSTLFPRASPDAPLRAWLALAATMQRCHSELAGELLQFADVPARAGAVLIEPERWSALAEAEEIYLNLLDRRGLCDPLTAQLNACRQDNPQVRDLDVVLLGTAELPAAARAALGHARSIASLVFAPPALADRFDHLGCVRTDAWCDNPLDVHDDQVQFVDTPADQAEQALVAIARAGAKTADQFAIGVPEPEVVPFLERLAGRTGAVRLRDAAGTPVRNTAPYRLLQEIAELLERQTFDTLRTLIRHPHIGAFLESAPAEEAAPLPPNWLDLLDAYAASSIHGRIALDPQSAEQGPCWHTDDALQLRALHRIHSHLAAALRPLLGPPQPAPQWADAARRTLEALYECQQFDASTRSGRIVLGACREIRSALDDLRDLPDSAAAWPAIDAHTALRLVLEEVADRPIPDEPDPEAIELLGWLELPLDPSSVTIVTGMNEGRVPASFGADPLLPDALRAALRLPCSRSRYARDAYVLTAIAASRPRALFIAGRRSIRNDPLWPSRLLLSCSDEEISGRIRRFLGKVRESSRLRLATALLPGVTSGFSIAPLTPAQPVESMPVTSFRTYLHSPYLFYLQYILRLQERAEGDRELDALSFGNLIHLVLERFGGSDARHSPRQELVRECLMDHLASCIRDTHGPDLSAPLRLQAEIARRRLDAFAQWQAQRVREGWLIFQPPEWRPSDDRGLLRVDGEPMKLRGRIDRIERHEDGRLAILDYKTGDNPADPVKAHRTRDSWIDLQLPLYRHLAEELGIDDRTVLGYIAIPRKREDLGLKIAEWSAEDLRSADEAAALVVRAVREGRFSDVGEPPQDPGALASLCGAGFLNAPVEAEAQEQ